MDKNSRNIVKFIATITIVALLVMAARYYAISRQVEAPPVVEEVAKPKAAPVESEMVEPEVTLDETEEADVIEEDVEIKMGEPSVNIGQEDVGYQELPPTDDPAPESDRGQ